MKSIFAVLVVILIPFTTQALAISGNGEASSEGTSVNTTLNASVGVPEGAVQKGNPETGTESENSLLMNTDDSEPEDGAESTITIKSATHVTTDPELSDFSKSITSTNRNVAILNTESSDAVEVTYVHNAKLFGFIPIRITSKTSVRTDSDNMPVVETTFPWWHIFLTGVANTSDTVDSSIAASASAKVYAEAKTSAHAKALIAETVIATLNAEEGVALLGQ